MSRLAQLGSQLFHANTSFRPKIVPCQKRIRGRLSGIWLFDTTKALLVWEIKYFPFLWIPRSDFANSVEFREDASISGIQQSTSKLTVGDKTISVLVVPDSFNSELAGYVKVEQGALDAWYEELSEIKYHPKDPFHRVDVLPTGRRVRVEIDGVVLADTGSAGGAMGVFETNFPARWYVPPTGVKWEVLRKSEKGTVTGCPYKGEAGYYDFVPPGGGKAVGDVAWFYQDPLVECAQIKGLVSFPQGLVQAIMKRESKYPEEKGLTFLRQLCFYPDKVETTVDGERIEKIGMPAMSAEDKASVQAPEPRSSCNC